MDPQLTVFICLSIVLTGKALGSEGQHLPAWLLSPTSHCGDGAPGPTFPGSTPNLAPLQGQLLCLRGAMG